MRRSRHIKHNPVTHSEINRYPGVNCTKEEYLRAAALFHKEAEEWRKWTAQEDNWQMKAAQKEEIRWRKEEELRVKKKIADFIRERITKKKDGQEDEAPRPCPGCGDPAGDCEDQSCVRQES